MLNKTSTIIGHTHTVGGSLGAPATIYVRVFELWEQSGGPRKPTQTI